MAMELEKAIRTAIVYETKVLKVYRDAVNESDDVKTMQFYQLMADEELSHVEYLTSMLEEWEDKGLVSETEIVTAVPSVERIAAGIKLMKKKFESERRDGAYGVELERLRRALALEEETSAFYRKVVDELPEENKGLFRRFLEIEEGHKAIVQAEIDAVEGFGFWFDAREFSMEGE